jgi:Flp pilus assembly pilin Flp
MKKFNFIRNNKGAMDNILVTLLLVIIGVALVVGLQSWMSGQIDTVQSAAETQITNATTDANGS